MASEAGAAAAAMRSVAPYQISVQAEDDAGPIATVEMKLGLLWSVVKSRNVLESPVSHPLLKRRGGAHNGASSCRCCRDVLNAAGKYAGRYVRQVVCSWQLAQGPVSDMK